MQKKQPNYDVLLNKIGVSRGTCDLLCVYFDMLKFWNKKINLVSRKSIEISWERHFLDSAQLWLYLPYKARKWLDFGSGAGFPALVLAVISRELQPELKFVLVEKNKKKAGFLLDKHNIANTSANNDLILLLFLIANSFPIYPFT